MSQSLDDTVKQIMSDILDLDIATIDDDTSMDNVAAWDSGNHISLVLAIEEELELSFDVSEIEAMTSCYDIISTIGSACCTW